MTSGPRRTILRITPSTRPSANGTSTIPLLRKSVVSVTLKPGLRRLLHDLAELERDPVPGVDVYVDDKHMTKMCAVLTPMSGRFAGVRIHLVVRIGEQYPKIGPEVSISSPIPHPNVFGSYICCDILKGSIVRGQDGYIGGYTPAYSLQTILIQLLSFFTAEKVEQDYGGVRANYKGSMEKVRTMVKQFRCHHCGYGIEFDACWNAEECSNSVVVSELHTSNSNKESCSLGLLDSVPDIWLIIADKLNDKDLTSLARAYPPFATLANNYSLTTRRTLKCFYFRTSFTQDILGVGILREPNLTSSRYSLSSDFELLSWRAFEGQRIRVGPWGQRFNGFLPLVMNEPHFKRARPVMEEALMWLDGRRGEMSVVEAVKSRGAFEPGVTIKVISKMMNQMVVNLMRYVSGGDDEDGQKKGATETKAVLHASEKALNGYCSLLHLLISLALKYPTIPQQSYEKVSSFISRETGRCKASIPDLGEFLIHLALTPSLKWDTICRPLLEELLARNVLWVLGKHPYLAYMEAGVSQKRMSATFEGSTTGLRLVMFQICFLKAVVWGEISGLSDVTSQIGIVSNTRSTDEWQTVSYRAKKSTKRRSPPYDPTTTFVELRQIQKRLGAHYGFPSPTLVTQLASRTREILMINTWSGFLDTVCAPANHFPRYDSTICTMLRNAVIESEIAGYHIRRYSFAELWVLRNRVEPAVCGDVPTTARRVGGIRAGRSFFPGRQVIRRDIAMVKKELMKSREGGECRCSCSVCVAARKKGVMCRWGSDCPGFVNDWD